MLPQLLGFVPSFISGVKEYVGKKQDLQKLQRESEVRIQAAQVEAKIRQIESADSADVALDSRSIEQTGWKDEYLLILTTIPLATVMISPYLDLAITLYHGNLHYTQGMLAKAVGGGFEEMDKLPEYYWWAVGAVYIHSLGMRRMVRQLLEKWGSPFKK